MATPTTPANPEEIKLHVPEQMATAVEPAKEQSVAAAPQKVETTPTVQPQSAVEQPSVESAMSKDPEIVEIEEILTEDLGDLYASLSPENKKKFRFVGEETAAKIRELSHQKVIQGGKINKLIKNWLHIVPDVNKFYLTQDAKIKTDEIVREQYEKRGMN